MNRLLLVLLLILPYFAFSQEEGKALKTKIEKVTVYLNGAEIAHQGSVSLSEGTSVLLVKGLSPKVVKESIRAQFSNGVKVLAVGFEQDRITKGKQDSVRLTRISDTIRIMDREKRRINAMQSALESEKQTIISNSNLVHGQNNVSVAELQRLSELYKTRMSEIFRLIHLNQENLMDIERVIVRYNDETQKLKSVVKVEYDPQIRITVHAPGPVTAQLSLKYLTGGAAWAPTYDIISEGSDKGIRLEYNANVMNQSGEDWKDVKITLSTTDPLQSHKLPGMAPWYLNYGGGSEQQSQNRKVSKEEAQASYGDIKILDNVQYEEMIVSNISVDFPITGNFSIPSNSRLYQLEVARHDLSASFRYIAIPKIERNAFLVARLTGWEKLNLIQGPSNIYFRGTYIGKAMIDPVTFDDTLDISLGRDNKVIVNRLKVEDKDAIKVIGSNKKETYTYKISVRNTNTNPINIQLSDQIPVSQHSEITVDIHEVSNAEREDYSGKLTWNLDIKSGETKEFIVSFSVKYPKNKTVKVQKSDKSNYRSVKTVRFL